KFVIDPHHRLVLTKGRYAHVGEEPWDNVVRLVDEQQYINPCGAADHAVPELHIAENNANLAFAIAARLLPTLVMHS
ncbi:hypothetical protein LPJ61_004966, partial [Coemansia biformis]